MAVPAWSRRARREAVRGLVTYAGRRPAGADFYDMAATGPLWIAGSGAGKMGSVRGMFPLHSDQRFDDRVLRPWTL